MDTLGPDRAGAAPANKLYSSNPYWQRSNKPAAAKPEPAQSVKETPPVLPTDALPPYLIAALVETIEKIGQSHRDDLIRQLTEWLPQIPVALGPTLEQHLDKLVPKVVKVEQPGSALLKLVRYLTGGMVVAGLLIGGLVFAWLQTRQQRDTYAAGYWQHRYVTAQTAVARTVPLQRLLIRTDSLYQSPSFQGELQRLESILDTRQQQYQLHLREQALTRPTRP
ncbi:hypothetical protein GGR92_004965 [Spirosoma lacussanchae]|uniref:hypothetical protein n=1 Tax=Spirosoma lacussanchae TaxID=1884249 RepID=UPI0011088177|nr:hypothetical protein [Spirosoma lacussanchae]